MLFLFQSFFVLGCFIAATPNLLLLVRLATKCVCCSLFLTTFVCFPFPSCPGVALGSSRSWFLLNWYGRVILVCWLLLLLLAFWFQNGDFRIVLWRWFCFKISSLFRQNLMFSYMHPHEVLCLKLLPSKISWIWSGIWS